LSVKVLAVFGSHQRSLGKHVLNLGSYFAEFDVFDERNDACVLANNVLESVNEV